MSYVYLFIDRFCYFVMVPMVYGAIAILLAGTLLRLIRMRLAPNPRAISLRVFPEKRSKVLAVLGDIFLFPNLTRKKDAAYWVFFGLFHTSLLLLLLGHLELIADIKGLQLVKHRIFLGNGFVGLLFGISLLFFLFRRFRSPYRELSIPEDFFIILGLLSIGFFGSHLNLAALYSRHGFDIPLEAYRHYLGSIIRLSPTVPTEISESPHQVILVGHIFLANLFFIYFPFSKLMHAILAFFSNAVKRS